MTQIRMDPEARKAQLLYAAFRIARKHGIKAVTRVSVAAACGCSVGVPSAYFGTRDALRKAVVDAAAEAGHNRLVLKFTADLAELAVRRERY